MTTIAGQTITFLFTDIEGSTRRWDAQRAAMSGALARHDALLRAAIEGRGGAVFKTVGDAFCAAFGSAAAALAAAVDAQRALAAEDWSAFGADADADAGGARAPEDPGSPAAFATLRVRMALHTGHAEARDGDYFGPPLNRAARLLSTGHGGQVLLSQTAFDLARDDLPAGASLRDLGEHRLKDLFRPERIFQLVAPGLPADFPALKTLDSRPNNLPVQPTSFVGRETEAAAVKARLSGARLLTLTGVGGTGKTRLALQVAADVLDDYPDGVWFVDLAPIVDPALVAQAAASAMGVAEQPGRTLAATLAEHLRGKRALVVLDNCEHVIEAAAALAAELVRSTADVRVLATSREALGVAGEANYAVSTLSVPEVGAAVATAADLQALTQYEAVRLFIDRAVAVKSDFAVTNANAPAVAGICQRLDGIPLAIELAAARVKHMPPEQILARLDQRFRLLTGGGRDRLPRQQTLAAAIEWSHGLLDEAEQAVFRRLAVFRGGWTLEAAEAVCGGEPVEDWEVVDVLLRLVDKSLVVMGEAGGAARYRFLETVREYARERLIAAGEREAYRERHVAYFVTRLAALGEIEDAGGDDPEGNPERVLAQMRADNENLSAAVIRACDAANTDAAVRLGAGLWRYWRDTAQCTAGSRLLRRVLAVERATDLRPRAFAHYGLGVLLIYLRDPGAETALTQAMAVFQASGDRVRESWCLNDLGIIATHRQDFATAEAFFEASLAVKREVASTADQSLTITNLGIMADQRGDLDTALARYEQAIAMCDAGSPAFTLHERLQISMARCIGAGNAGDVLLELGRYREAEERYRLSIGEASAHGVKLAIPESLARFGWLAAACSDWRRAAVLMGASDRLFVETETTFDTELNRQRHARAIATTRAALGDAAFDAAHAEGWAMDADAAVAYALEDGDA